MSLKITVLPESKVYDLFVGFLRHKIYIFYSIIDSFLLTFRLNSHYRCEKEKVFLRKRCEKVGQQSSLRIRDS
jgi:hypothetical protein